MISIESSIGNLKARLPMRSIIGKGWRGIGKTLTDYTKEGMHKPKHGRTYIINGKKHTASAGGESPAIISGALENSVGYKIRGDDMDFGAGDENIDYAKFLELGTVKMESRSFIVKAVEENFKEIKIEFENSFKSGAK